MRGKRVVGNLKLNEWAFVGFERMHGLYAFRNILGS